MERLAADGTPWFPPLTAKQKDILRRRTVTVQISYDPDIDASPVPAIAKVLNAALAETEWADMYVSNVRGCIGEWDIKDTQYNRQGETVE